jgi:hypothetical protein
LLPIGGMLARSSGCAPNEGVSAGGGRLTRAECEERLATGVARCDRPVRVGAARGADDSFAAVGGCKYRPALGVGWCGRALGAGVGRGGRKLGAGTGKEPCASGAALTLTIGRGVGAGVGVGVGVGRAMRVLGGAAGAMTAPSGGS